MATARKNQGRAGDYTGKQKAALEEKAAVEREAKAEQLAMATAAAAPKLQEPIDLEPKKDEAEEKVVGELAVTDVDVSQEKVKFRVNETLDSVTIGHGNNFDFVEGQEYYAQAYIRDYLEERGFIWH